MIRMTIGDQEIYSNKEFTIKEEMQNTSSTILNNAYPKEWETTHDYVSNFYYPEDYSLCKITKDDNLIFAGIVENSGEISLNPRYPKYCSLQILGFETLLSEGETLDFVIDNKTVEQAIDEVISAISDYGFVKGNINILKPDEVIGTYSTQEKTAYDVFNYLANISGSIWQTRLLNENSIAIDFYDPSLMPEGTTIEYTKEFFDKNLIDDISFNYSSRDYRNRQIILSSQVLGGTNYTDTVRADGYATSFNTSAPIGAMVGITVNGVSKTFATNTDKELGTTADFYYSVQKQEVSTDDLLSAGTQIMITYIPIVQGRQVVNNSEEINRVQNNLNRKGVIARYESRNDVASSDELYRIGQTYLKYKGIPEVTLNVTTRKRIWNVGQSVHFNAPLKELRQDYMVKSCEVKVISTIEEVFYTYELSSSYNAEKAINYFDNQRSKVGGNLKEGEFITRNVDVVSSANIIFDNLVITEVNE